MLIAGARAHGDDVSLHGRPPRCQSHHWIPSHEHPDAIRCIFKGFYDDDDDDDDYVIKRFTL